jgi:hypothetical protein
MKESLARSIAGIRQQREHGHMRNTLLNQRTINIAFVVVAMLVAAITAEASSESENLLLSAGFKAQVAKTVSQRRELKTLPEGKLSQVTQNGKTFYVYPDAQHNQLYIGDEAQYQIYQDRVTEGRGSARPIVDTDDVRGNQIKVREFNGWEPFGE